MNIYDRPTPRTDYALRHQGSTYNDVVSRCEAMIALARRLERELDTVRDAHMANCLAADTLRNEIRDLRERSSINVDGRDFYELCQQYRHARHDPLEEFAALQRYIKTGALPWQSYETRNDAASVPSKEGS